GDQEAESTWLVARRVLDAFLARSAPPADDASADDIAEYVAGARLALTATIESLDAALVGPDARDAVLRQRAVLGFLTGCWLDVVSQAATQPSVIVNQLFVQHFRLRGQANPRRTLSCRRRQRLEQDGVFLPEIAAADFLAAADARPLTALHGSFYLALS